MSNTDQEKNIKLLRRAIKQSISDLKSFDRVSPQKSAVIISQDSQGKSLSKKNKLLIEKYIERKGTKTADQKLEIVSDILFRNFHIHESTLEILKSYTDEYYERFKY